MSVSLRAVSVRIRSFAAAAAGVAATACAVATFAALPAAAAPGGLTSTVKAGAATRHDPHATPGLPRGFSVRSFSTTSHGRWWVSGVGADGRAVLLRTDDTGARWSRISLPTRAVDSPGSGMGPQVAFSGRNRGMFTVGGGVWATRDGGRSWRYGGPWDASITQIAASPDAAYALLHTAAGWYLTRAAAGSIALHDVLRPAQLGGTTPSVATSGATVVVVGGRHIWRSTDDGRHFTRTPGPCTEDLGGEVSVAGPTAVTWCATGTDGVGFVSTDRAATFHAVHHAVGVNSCFAAATGAGATIVFAGPTGGVVRVRNGAPDQHSGAQLGPVSWVGYSTPQQVFAIAGTRNQKLWRSTNGGTTWSAVHI